jgi:hypothetical protein
MSDPEFKTPRFVITAFFCITTTIAFLFIDKMSAGDYVMFIGIALSAYGATAGIALLKDNKKQDDIDKNSGCG